MQIDNTSVKTVLRYLQKTSPQYYLVPQKVKVQLGYPQQCVKSPQDQPKLSEMMSIDCEMILTQKGQQLCRVVIVDQKFNVLYNKWFLTEYPVIDYLSHITGITQTILKQNASQKYTIQHKKQIQSLIKNKIVVGHDLANDLRVLDIQHHAFIDTIHICPHNFGLPHKNKLKNLAMQLLRKPIQWGNHDPIQDAVTALQITLKHLSQGKGIVQQVQFNLKKPQEYQNIWEIMEDAQLEKIKIIGLFLRGSRALGLQMNVQGYKSDWDYFCVYDTWAKIDGRLIKLPQTDITIYDINTFNHYIHNQNDLPLLELFSLPLENQIINKLQYPIINIQKLRQSLGFHLMKSKMKIKRFKPDPTKYWKVLKAVHMKMRFMDYFLQIFDHGKIINVKNMNPIWEDFKSMYENNKNFQLTYKKCETIANQFMEKVREKYQSLRKVHGQNLEKQTQKVKSSIIGTKKNKLEEKQHKLMKVMDSSLGSFKPNILHGKLHIVKQIRQNSFNNMDKYKIITKRGVLYPNLIQFKYMQSASFKNPICHQARGIILDQSRDYQIVALPYYKFFDYNDKKYSQLKDFDFRKYRIYQKFDGSIAFIYFYANQWHVASSSVPDATTNYCFARKETTTEFRKQFWRIFNELKYELPDKKDRNKTFVFELMSKNHIIVTNRNQDSIVLHGVRNVDTLQEEDHLIYNKKYNWKVAEPIQLPLQNKLDPMKQIVEITQKLDPLKQQGFVLCDHKYTRIKVKSSNYLRINWLGELNLTKNKDPSKYILIKIILAGEAETFAQYCPEWSPVIKQFSAKIQKLNDYVIQHYQPLKNLDKKQFVVEVKKKSQQIQHFLFELKKNYDLLKGRIETIMHPKKFHNFITTFDFQNI